MFLKHSTWEEPEWITKMREEYFENKYKHNQGRGNVEPSEDTNCGLYSQVLTWINLFDYNCMPNIYLEQVKLNLMKPVEHGYTY